MPRKSPFHIDLSVDESAELNRRATKYTLPYFEVVRAKMLLMAADGMDNDEIADLPGVSGNRSHQVVAGALVASAVMDIFDEVDEIEVLDREDDIESPPFGDAPRPLQPSDRAPKA